MSDNHLNIQKTDRERIIILGCGFAGIELAKALRDTDYQVVVFDKNNYFTFQPLLYQVATGGLEPNSIAYPYRRFFKNNKNVLFRMTCAEELLPSKKLIRTSDGSLNYDYLVMATGSMPQFFNMNPELLLPMKSVPDALKMRNFLLEQFEKALLAKSEDEREALLNIVVVGGGPTGVELAGALGEMKKFTLPKDYPEMHFDDMKIVLAEGEDRLLPPMSKEASFHAKKFLEELGVEVHLNTMVNDFNGKNALLNEIKIPTENLIWTTGVKGMPVNGLKADLVTKAQRVKVDHYNRIIGYEDIFAIGDLAMLISDEFPRGLPMLAPVAIQQGKHLGKNFERLKENKSLLPFEYKDKGTMATIGRNRAVVDTSYWKTQGFVAWFVWMYLHLMSLVGFRNKLIVFVNWVINYLTYDKALRLIIKHQNLSTKVKKNKKIYS